MIVRLVTPPAIEPVTLIEAKAHLRILHDQDDPYIESLIPAARQMVESGESWSLERSLITTEWKVTLDRFDRVIELPRPPLLSVSSIAYVDTAGATRTLSPTLYTVDGESEPGRLTAAYGQWWPTTRYLEGAGSVTITYSAGYGDTAASVPQAIRQAILLLVGDLYEFRTTTLTGTIQSTLPAVRALLVGHKWSFS